MCRLKYALPALYNINNTTNSIRDFSCGSDKLRCALNLSPEDYPPYISRMLIHGYPPGYRLLEEENYLTLIDGESVW